MKGVANTETTNGLPRIVRLASRCIDILSDNPGRRSADLWLLINEALAGFEHIVSNLEQDWIRSELAAYNDENSIRKHQHACLFFFSHLTYEQRQKRQREGRRYGQGSRACCLQPL